MPYSFVTFHSKVGDFACFEEHLIIQHDESDDVEKIFEAHLISQYVEVEEPMQEGTIVFAGHKNGDSIIVSIESIVELSTQQTIIMRTYIPTIEPNCLGSFQRDSGIHYEVRKVVHDADGKTSSYGMEEDVQADDYGVYTRDDDGLLVWIADFKSYEDALIFLKSKEQEQQK